MYKTCIFFMYVLQLMMDVNSNIYMDIDEYQQMRMNVNK